MNSLRSLSHAGACSSAGSVYARDWRAVRRLTDAAAVQRAWACHWYAAARMAEREAGDLRRARVWRGLARRAAAKAAALRARIMGQR